MVEGGGTLDVDRLHHNMLSSMPMCFNLFGMLCTMPDGQLPLVRACFDATAEAVEMIECEWVPEHPASTLSDRTAFDAAIVTRRSDGSRHLIAIETKYTEPFSQTRYGARSHDAGKYRGMHEASGWSNTRATMSSPVLRLTSSGGTACSPQAPNDRERSIRRALSSSP